MSSIGSSAFNNLHVALVGKTGSGKSSTGNTLLGFRGFQVSSDANSVTRSIKTQRCSYGETLLYVYDTPGLKEVDCSVKDDIRNAFTNMRRLMEMSQSLDALVLVLSFPTRFTEEEVEIIGILIAAFGEDFLRNHCIVVITRGDVFANTNEDNPIPFEDWCRKQKGKIQELFEEVDYRVVLFYNESEEYEKQKAEGVQKLLGYVKELKSKNGCYTMEQFKEYTMQPDEIEEQLELM